MGSTDSTATSGKVFAPPIWRPSELKSKEENVASFRVYASEVKKQMDRHMELLEQGISKGESRKEKGETSNKRKRGIEKNGCGEWPVIVVDSDNDKTETKHEEAVGAEEKADESEEEDESEEDEETDENSESDLNSDLETESEKEVAVDLDEASEPSRDVYSDGTDDGSDSDPSSGNPLEPDMETSEDSSMFRMKIPD